MVWPFLWRRSIRSFSTHLLIFISFSTRICFGEASPNASSAPQVVRKYAPSKNSKDYAKGDEKKSLVKQKPSPLEEKKAPFKKVCPKLSSPLDCLSKDIESALKHVEEKSPGVHKQALKVWKNFNKKTRRRDPHYAYRYWARDILLYLKEERHMQFASPHDVMKVFASLALQDKISHDAAMVLTSDGWGYLVHLFGAPSPSAPPSPSHNKKSQKGEKRV